MEPLIAGASWTDVPARSNGLSGEYRSDGRDFLRSQRKRNRVKGRKGVFRRATSPFVLISPNQNPCPPNPGGPAYHHEGGYHGRIGFDKMLG
jgi:hypothetical protein